MNRGPDSCHGFNACRFALIHGTKPWAYYPLSYISANTILHVNMKTWSDWCTWEIDIPSKQSFHAVTGDLSCVKKKLKWYVDHTIWMHLQNLYHLFNNTWLIIGLFDHSLLCNLRWAYHMSHISWITYMYWCLCICRIHFTKCFQFTYHIFRHTTPPLEYTYSDRCTFCTYHDHWYM